MASTDPPPQDEETQPWPTHIPPSLLLLIIDLHPLSWSLLASSPPDGHVPVNDGTKLSKGTNTPIKASEFITILMVFLNAHMASRWGNRVVVFGASAGRSKLLYPAQDTEMEPGPSRLRANTYFPFQLLDSSLERNIKQMIQEEESRIEEGEGKSLNDPPAIVSAITKALCHINRHHPHPAAHAASGTDNASTTGPEKLETRILVINATPGGPAVDINEGTNGDGAEANANGKGKGKAQGGMRGGYVGLMNCVFAAQKAKVPIDVLSLPPPWTNTAPPIFLQQAAHLTEGVYWRWIGKGGLLQYLHGIYLPPPCLRSTPFAVPPQDAVDFRAVCFCHHDVVDVGFVCSVCLSIFCKPLPVCLMCKTKFPIKSLPTLKALAANIDPVPIPKTTLPPPKNTDRKAQATMSLKGGKKGVAGGAGAGAGGSGTADDAIVVD